MITTEELIHNWDHGDIFDGQNKNVGGFSGSRLLSTHTHNHACIPYYSREQKHEHASEDNRYGTILARIFEF